MNAFRVVVVAPLLLLLMAGTCEPTDVPEAPATEACAVAGLCAGSVVDDRPGAGVGIDIVDDGRPVLRGLYLDELDDVLASASATTALLGWIGAEGFERISCYDTGAIFDDPTSSARLATFIARARREAGVVEVAAVRGTVGGFADVVAWNARVDAAARFNVLTLEHEWWNGAGTFAEHTRLLGAMHDLADSSAPPPRHRRLHRLARQPRGRRRRRRGGLHRRSHGRGPRRRHRPGHGACVPVPAGLRLPHIEARRAVDGGGR